MLCTSCRRTLFSRFQSSLQTRTVATVPSTPNAASSLPPKTSSNPGNAPAATSSNKPGESQPLSTPFFPSTAAGKSSDTSKAKNVKKPTQLRSYVVAGTELRGLGYTKAKPQILAKEDDKYPDWLWGLLDEKKSTADGAQVDLSALSKKKRQIFERKQARLMKDVPKPIPLHEQSKDLTEPGADALTSLDRRQELTKSSREARRKGIRESNFLKGL